MLWFGANFLHKLLPLIRKEKRERQEREKVRGGESVRVKEEEEEEKEGERRRRRRGLGERGRELERGHFFQHYIVCLLRNRYWNAVPIQPA